GNRSKRELTEIADRIVKTQVERAKGVGQVRIIGGIKRSINVWVDAKKLAAYEIPITAVREAIVRQNADIPGGNVTGAQRAQTLRTMGQFTNAEGFHNLVITNVNRSPIRVRDVG